MPSIHVVPDKTYALMQVNERFELDESLTRSPRFPLYLEATAKEVARYAADKYKLRGWHWRSDLAVEIDKSELQYDLLASAGDELPTQDQYSQLLYNRGLIAFVVRMWFQVPQARTEVLEPEELAEADGFVEMLPNSGELAPL